MESRARLAGPGQFVLKAVKANWFVMVLYGGCWPVQREMEQAGDLLHSRYWYGYLTSQPQHTATGSHNSVMMQVYIWNLFVNNLRTPQNIIQTSRAHQVPRVQCNITQSPAKNFIRSAITLLKILYRIHHTPGPRRKVKYVGVKMSREENIRSLFVLDSRYKLQLLEALITHPCSCNY